MMPAAQRRQQQGYSPRTPQRTMNTSGCNGNCNCSACPTGLAGQNVTVNQIAQMLGREVAGLSGKCKYNMLHLNNVNQVVGIAAGATETLFETAQMGLCVQQIVVSTRDVAVPATVVNFTLRDFSIANKPQWLQGRLYHSQLFAFNAECSCCLPGDCTTIGSQITITVINNAPALAANIDVYLIGPATA